MPKHQIQKLPEQIFKYVYNYKNVLMTKNFKAKHLENTPVAINGMHAYSE